MVKLAGVSDVVRNADRWQQNVRNAASVAVEMTGAMVVNYAKQSAPWTDRTGEARGSIHAEFRDSVNVISTSVGIGADHGVYLELSNGGKYRVVDPAVFTYGRTAFMNNLKGIM